MRITIYIVCKHIQQILIKFAGTFRELFCLKLAIFCTSFTTICI
nr:MAG TPA: hypothetical protein [Caudoviricetes sp.]